ncbi:UNVERIFIED_CONTAM: hypothetical protein NCL1_41549 [Trichonephila clavipes]
MDILVKFATIPLEMAIHDEFGEFIPDSSCQFYVKAFCNSYQRKPSYWGLLRKGLLQEELFNMA